MSLATAGSSAELRLVLLNWRDPWHPRGGGAEFLTLRLLQHVVSAGADVEWFSSAYDGAPGEEIRHGIRFVRRGTELTCRFHAWSRYAAKRDRIYIDQINTLPFLTPLQHPDRTIAFFHQLAREVWLFEAPFPLSVLGFLAEPLYLRIYRNRPLITVSPSSARSLRDIGLRGPLELVPECVDDQPVESPDASGDDIVVVGRVTPSKRIGDSVRAAAILRSRGWGGKLRVIGSGKPPYVARLKRLAAQLGAPVEFSGRVPETVRRDAMRSAALLWMTSVREGWGLVVMEAARNGTPAVVYDVPGLRDAVVQNITGAIVDERPEALASATARLLDDRSELLAMSAAAVTESRNYTWERSGAAFLKAVLDFAPRPSTTEVTVHAG